MMTWRLGVPGWRLAATFGMPISVKIDIWRDTEAGVYVAVSDNIGLAVEADSLDKLIAEVHAAMPLLLEQASTAVDKPKADIRLHDDLAMA